MIILQQTQYEQLLSHALKTAPNEACGLIGGTVAKDIKTVQKVYPLTNLDDSPEHFSMDPQEQFEAVKDMRKNGWTLLGNFHSHPNSPSRPSEEDKRLAFDSEASYLILSLQDENKPVLKGFIIKNNIVNEENIVLGGQRCHRLIIRN